MVRHLFIALTAAFALLAGANALAADANKAGAAELEAVKGIGPALSGKILAARQQAPFKSWADMVERVPGMGPGNAARLSQNGLTVGSEAYAPVATAAKSAKTDPGARADKAKADKTAPAKPAAAKAQG